MTKRGRWNLGKSPTVLFEEAVTEGVRKHRFWLASTLASEAPGNTWWFWRTLVAFTMWARQKSWFVTSGNSCLFSLKDNEISSCIKYSLLMDLASTDFRQTLGLRLPHTVGKIRPWLIERKVVIIWTEPSQADPQMSEWQNSWSELFGPMAVVFHVWWGLGLLHLSHYPWGVSLLGNAWSPLVSTSIHRHHPEWASWLQLIPHGSFSSI